MSYAYVVWFANAVHITDRSTKVTALYGLLVVMRVMMIPVIIIIVISEKVRIVSDHYFHTNKKKKCL